MSQRRGSKRQPLLHPLRITHYAFATCSPEIEAFERSPRLTLVLTPSHVHLGTQKTFTAHPGVENRGVYGGPNLAPDNIA